MITNKPSRRWRDVVVSREDVLNCLFPSRPNDVDVIRTIATGIPATAKVYLVYDVPEIDAFVFRLEDDTFEVVPEGCKPERMKVNFSIIRDKWEIVMPEDPSQAKLGLDQE